MIDDIDIQKGFFHPICNKEEIECVFNVQSAKDYLLKLRAETIVDHMRLFRVYRNKALIDEKNWSLEASFDTPHYYAFLKALDNQNSRLCKIITFGNLFSNDPNGTIFKTEFGPIITISDSLRFFLKFMHLALLSFETEVPEHVRINSLRIAIRVMLKTEALDFLMDPRGIVPKDVAECMHAPINDQLTFIAGHEFSHHILGHISDDNVIDKPIFFAIAPDDEDYKPMKVYNNSQKEEFAADIGALRIPNYNGDKHLAIFEASLLWFACLHLYEAAIDTLCPKNSLAYKTHPTALERFKNIIENEFKPNQLDTQKWMLFIKDIEPTRDFLINDISANTDFYERYGSAYLDEPNTQWRGKELIDREDYY